MIFEKINGHLADRSVLTREDPIVNATIYCGAALHQESSEGAGSEDAQDQKRQRVVLRQKAHIGTGAGADADADLVHSLTGTAANVADVTESENLLHCDEIEAYADAGYTCVARRDEFKDKNVTWHVAEKRGNLKKMVESPPKNLVTQFERAKAQIRAKLEYPFHVIKNLFRYRKVRYRRLLKNTAQLFRLFTLGNLIYSFAG